MTEHPLIFVDIVEEKPLTRPVFDDTYGVTDDTGEHAYRDYLARFQPWRIVVRSARNHKVLFRSSERYFNERDALHTARITFGPNTDVYLRREGSSSVELRRGGR